MNELKIDMLDVLEKGQGYYLGFSFSKNELELVRSEIEAHWLENIKRNAPTQVEKFSEIGINRYHELACLLDHELIWPKINRILPKKSLDYIRSTSLIKSLEDIYGDFEISDEENIGREEIYWRLVRPNHSSDVGPLHADAWYWDLDHGVTPSGVKRVKVWAAIYCEPGLNGLCVVPYSQKRSWKYHSEYRDGFSKPKIDEDESSLPVSLVDTKHGDAIVFHDRLLHGGVLNRGSTTRVSLEFTMFVKKNSEKF